MSQIASGSIGGITFARGKAGAYARRRSRPVKSRTPEITNYHYSVFKYVVQEWLNAGTVVRGLWNDFATRNPLIDSLGNSFQTNGYMWYMKLNCAAAKYHGSIQQAPPTTPLPNYHPNFTLNWTASGASLAFNIAINTAHAIVVYQRTTNRQYPLSQRTLSLATILKNGDTSPQLITQPCNNGPGPGNFPSIVCGTMLQFNIFTCDVNGRCSTRLFYNLLTS